MKIIILGTKGKRRIIKLGTFAEFHYLNSDASFPICLYSILNYCFPLMTLQQSAPMKKTLMIPLAGALAALASCAQMKAPASEGKVSGPTKEQATSSSGEGQKGSKDHGASASARLSGASTGTSISPMPSSSRPTRSHGDSTGVSGVTLPPLPDMGGDSEEYALPPAPLPGDIRGNLRAPEMPSTLPMSVDGKINPSAF